MKTLLAVKFDVNDLDASYEIIGTSDNYSFQYQLGLGSDLLEGLQGNEYTKVVDLKGNYGIFDVRVFAISNIGIRSEFVEEKISIAAPEFYGTYVFTDLSVFDGNEILSKSVVKAATIEDNELIVSSEFVGRSINLKWKMTPPVGHPKEGEEISAEILSDSFFSHFEVNIYDGTEGRLIGQHEIDGSAAIIQKLSSTSPYEYLQDYKNVVLEINEPIFNDLDLSRNVKFEILCYDSIGGVARAEISCINRAPIVSSFNVGDSVLRSEFNWQVLDKDKTFENIYEFAIPFGTNLYSEYSVYENYLFFKNKREALDYELIKGRNYKKGEMFLFEDDNVYQAKKTHDCEASNQPGNDEFWQNVGEKCDYLYKVHKVDSGALTSYRMWGYSYYYSLVTNDRYGLGVAYNLTEEGLRQINVNSVLREFSSNIQLTNLRFRENKDTLIFNWDIVDGSGLLVDLEQYRYLYESQEVPQVLGVKAYLINEDTNQTVLEITPGNNSFAEVDGKVISGFPTAKIFNTFDYTRDLNNQIFKTGGFPDSKKFEVGSFYGAGGTEFVFMEGGQSLFESLLENRYSHSGLGDISIMPVYDNWSPSKTYVIGDFFQYEKSIYYTKKEFGKGSNESNFKGLWSSEGTYVIGDLVVAPTVPVSVFNSNKAYTAGEYVIYQEEIYLCFQNQNEINIKTPGTDNFYWQKRGIFNDVPCSIFRLDKLIDTSGADYQVRTPSELLSVNKQDVNHRAWVIANPQNTTDCFELIASEFVFDRSDLNLYKKDIDLWQQNSVYKRGSMVVYENDLWIAVKAASVGQAPGGSHNKWENTLNSQNLTSNYNQGDLVYYNGTIYECLSDNPEGAPILAVFDESRTSNYNDCEWRPFWQVNNTFNDLAPFAHIGIPEGGKRSIGFKVSLITSDQKVMSSSEIVAFNPPPDILRQGFTTNSTSKASRVRFNFNYREGFAEKTTKVNLYRSSEPEFDITGSNKFAASSTEEFLDPTTPNPDYNASFVKTIIGEGEHADFGDNITEIFDDPPLFVDSDGIEHPTGYYYKILPFDDFGSGNLYGVKDNMHGLEKVIVYPKSYHSPNPHAPIGEIPKANQPGVTAGDTTTVIVGESIPGPVANFAGVTAFENYFLNWDLPNSEILKEQNGNKLVAVQPNDIDHFEVWESNESHLEVNNTELTKDQNLRGYRRILGDLPSFGNVPPEELDIGYDITNATEIMEIAGDGFSFEAIHQGRTNERRYFWIRAVDAAGNKSPFTGAADLGTDTVSGLELTLGQAKTTDIADFEQNITATFPNTLALVPNDPFSDNTSQPGSIAWERHFVYYNGTGYVIGAGETDDAFVYWSATGRTPTHLKDIVPLTDTQSGELGLTGPGGGVLDSSINNPLRNILYSGGYDTSDYHPAGAGHSTEFNSSNPDAPYNNNEFPNLLGETDDFIIARNANGIATTMWHSFANATIGTAHIEEAAITSAKIHTLTADKIRSAEIKGQDIQVGGTGQIRSFDFSGLADTGKGFVVSGDGSFVFAADDGRLHFDDGELVLEGKLRQIDGKEYTFLDLDASPDSFFYDELADGTYAMDDHTDVCNIRASFQNSFVQSTGVRFKISDASGNNFVEYTDHDSNGRYNISGFRYDPSSDFVAGEPSVASAQFDITGFDEMIHTSNPPLSTVIISVSGDVVSYERSMPINLVADGAPGPTGRSPIYRGLWSDQKDYTGVLEGTNGFDDLRGDVVFLSGEYYIAKNNSGPGTSVGPKNPGISVNENFWAEFGAQFESVATTLLLAEDAIITHNLVIGEEDPNNPGAGAGGVIKTAGKEFENGIPGFFLSNTGVPPNPQFDVGGTGSFIRFDSDSNRIEIKGSLIINSRDYTDLDINSIDSKGDDAIFIGGGYNNFITGSQVGETGFASSIVGGGANDISGRFSFIGGGFNNNLGDNFSAIVAGYNNEMPNLESGNAGANFIGAGVKNIIDGGTNQTIVNGFENEIFFGPEDITIGSSNFKEIIYDPDNSLLAEGSFGKGKGVTRLLDNGWAFDTNFPTSGTISDWQNVFFASYEDAGELKSLQGLNSGFWIYPINLGWVFVPDQKDKIFASQGSRWPGWIYLSTKLHGTSNDIGWTYWPSDHTFTGITTSGGTSSVSSGEAVLFYSMSHSSTSEFIYVCVDPSSGEYYYLSLTDHTSGYFNWQLLYTLS